MEKQKAELIEKYIQNKLTEAEKQEFSDWLIKDEQFKKEVKFQENLAAVAKEDMRQKLLDQIRKQENKLANKKKRTIRRVALVLTGILLIASAFLGYQREKRMKSPEGIYASHYETYPNVYYPVKSGNTDLMTKAFTAYENGDFSDAAEQIGERLKTSSSNELKFYQAISYAEIGNFPLAIKNLEDIKRFQSDYTDEAYWYLGLFYLKMQNKPTAIRHFQDYIEITDNEKLKQKAIKVVKNLI